MTDVLLRGSCSASHGSVCHSNSATWDLDLKLLDKTRLGVITVRCKFGIVLALIY